MRRSSVTKGSRRSSVSSKSRLLKPTESSMNRRIKTDQKTRAKAVERTRGRKSAQALGNDVSKRDLQMMTPRVGNTAREMMSARMSARYPLSKVPASHNYVQSNNVERGQKMYDVSSDTIVACPFSGFGCEEEIEAGDLYVHVEQTFKEHLQMTINAEYTDSAMLVAICEDCGAEFGVNDNKDEDDPSKFDSDYEIAMQYHQNGQYEEASTLLETLTVKGHPRAMYLLGCYCDWGLGYGRDLQLAQEYFQFAALRGHAQAQLSLGACLYNGENNEDIRHQAVYWFWRACNLDNAEAMYLLGGCYELGDIVEQSWKSAYYWYARAGVSGHSDGLHAAARCLQEGRLSNPLDELSATEAQLTQAACMFQHGARKKHPSCVTQLGLCFELGKGVRQNYKTASDYYKEATKLGCPRGTGCLAGCYLNGFGLERNVKKALELFRKASDLGDAYSTKVCNEFAAIQSTGKKK